MEAVDVVVVVVVVCSSWSCSTFSPFTKGSSSTSSLACWQAKVLQQKQQLRTTTEAANQDPSVTISSVPCGPPTSEVIFYYIYISVWQKKFFSLIYTAPLKTNFYNLGVNISREMMYYYSSSSLFTLLGLALEEFTVCLHLPSSLFTSDLWIPWCHFQPRFIPQLYTNDIWRSVRITNTRELSSSHHHTRHINS